jgi:hypothetical protein
MFKCRERDRNSCVLTRANDPVQVAHRKQSEHAMIGKNSSLRERLFSRLLLLLVPANKYATGTGTYVDDRSPVSFLSAL